MDGALRFFELPLVDFIVSAEWSQATGTGEGKE